MNKVRQGILQRPQINENVRNQTSNVTQFTKECNDQQRKQDKLYGFAHHRRIVDEGTRDEKRDLKNQTKSDLDIQYQTKRTVLNNINHYEKQQDKAQLNHYENQGKIQDTKEQVRREYQKQIMEENKQLALMKVDRSKNQKINEWQHDTRSHEQRSVKNAMDYL